MKLLELFDKANGGDYAWEPIPMQIEETIIRDCADYLREASDCLTDTTQMWRGSLDHEKKFQRVESRLEDREPKDTKKVVHDAINKFFEKHFGWKARNGVFASGHISTAHMYGKPYAIFPIGSFSYVWSPDVVDLHGDYGHFLDNYAEYEDYDQLERGLEHGLKWKTDDLQTAIKKGNEIMLNCKAYYMMDVDLVDELDWEYIHSAI